MPFRIGHGFDVHAFGPGDRVIIGGVRIPYSKGVVAHSDGDVLIHALCDALLGAAALGDIGQHFPDASEDWRGADSRELLRHVATLLTNAAYRVENADCTVIAQAPKIAPHLAAMRVALSEDLGIDIGQISIKATTNEKMGHIGRGEGLAAHAVALIQRGA
ncbi:MAG: 2-C-methyl-D-erythritol 2,4-cyclodiphosphate synthase [Gammaproteobacteria bacterium]|nr:2-C-methyl-D-erythritol 2,4-cyclodiphosphate synthase [Gammaproteobacteria bacterium]